jgi:hypothetical protein
MVVLRDVEAKERACASDQ